jgi:divalent metal cation (Fe/Co/Zn/Cd) transporter
MLQREHLHLRDRFVTTVTLDRAAVLRRRIRLIVAFTIAYNIAEAAISLLAGKVASSTALIAFGLDSVIEVLSATAVAWQFSRRHPQRYERPTLRVIAIAFFALATWVTIDSVAALVSGSEAAHSPVGIMIAAASVAIMPTVSFLERRAGRELNSATAVADSKQTLVCAYLSVALLVGLVANSTLGWWWADAAAALVIAGFAVKEGVEAWKGDACSATAGAILHGSEVACDDDCCVPATDGGPVGPGGRTSLL